MASLPWVVRVLFLRVLLWVSTVTANEYDPGNVTDDTCWASWDNHDYNDYCEDGGAGTLALAPGLRIHAHAR